MKPGGLSTKDIMGLEAEYIAQTFQRHPVAWVRGEGCRLYDQEGRAYLDFFSGHAVMNLGFGHPAQQAAMRDQLGRLVHTGNLFYLEPQVRLARLLVEKTFGDKVFFSNSGSEIVELAIKLGRKWARRQRPGEDRYEILTLQGSFHGRTYGALSATGQDKMHQGLAPLLPGFKYVPFNDPGLMAAAISGQTCAIMAEPVQGEGGVHPGSPDYLRELRQLCDQHGLLLIFDEIQCGLGRTGYFNAYDHYQVVPDVLLLGKALGGGLPLSALITRNEIAAAMAIGDHGSTFGGNPVAAVGGLSLGEQLAEPGFLKHVRETGEHLGAQLSGLVKEFPGRVLSARGRGLMWGLELADHGPLAVAQALAAGLVLNNTAGHTLRFLPALTIEQKDVDEALATVKQVLRQLPWG